jgi:hypothetical protein
MIPVEGVLGALRFRSYTHGSAVGEAGRSGTDFRARRLRLAEKTRKFALADMNDSIESFHIPLGQVSIAIASIRVRFPWCLVEPRQPLVRPADIRYRLDCEQLLAFRRSSACACPEGTGSWSSRAAARKHDGTQEEIG